MKLLKKSLVSLLALTLGVNMISANSTTVLAAGTVSVSNAENTVTIGNEYITREFSTKNNKLATNVITNNRTGETPTLLYPESGSEEFIINLLNTVSSEITATPLSNDGWTATADSVATNEGSSGGNPQFMFDDNDTTYYHSNLNGSQDELKYPHNIYVDMGSSQTIKAVRYQQRIHDGNPTTGGRVQHFKLYVADSLDELKAATEPVYSGTFKNERNSYVNVSEEGINTRYIRIEFSSIFQPIDSSNVNVAACSEFDFYSELLKLDTDPTIKSSQLELNGQPVIETITKDGKTGKSLKFNFKPITKFGVPYTISEVITMYNEDLFMRKHLEISVPTDKSADAKISYIDLENMDFAAADLNEGEYWTIPEQADNPDMANMKGDFLELGQPYYIGAMYFGSEFPQTENKIVDGNGYIRYWYGKSLAKDPHFEYNKNNTAGFMETWPAVVGAARSRDYLVCQADFYEYIETIATPTDFRQQYNSWYDLMKDISAENIQESFYEIEKGFTQYGVNPLDSYVVDDGWMNYSSFWAFNDKFPNELYDASLQVQQLGSNFGLWLGPRGGYGTQTQIANWITANGYGSKNPQSGNDINISDARYVKKLLSDIFLSYQDKFDINYWKLDGMLLHPATAASEYYVTGNPFYTLSETYERWTDMFEDMRAQEGVSKDLWINLTSYLNPSPWYLQWVNSVWMQNTGDTGYTQEFNSTDAEQTLTYRDGAYYNFIFERQWQLPNKYFYNHDPVYGLTAHNSYKPNQISFTTNEMRDYLYMLGTRGTAFWEYYYSYSMFDDEKWQVNAEAANWIEDNFDILQKSKMFSAGNPRDGKVYGYSCWNGEDGIVSIRNPLDSEQNYTLTFDRLVGVTEGIKDIKGKVVVGDLRWQTEDLKVSYGDVVTYTLKPKEVLIVQYGETDTTPASIQSIHADENVIEVKFDETVRTPQNSIFTVNGNTVTNVELKADKRTVKVTLQNKLTHAQNYTINVNGVLDIAGNTSTGSKTDDYYKDDVIAKLGTTEFNNSAITVDQATSVDGHRGFSITGKINTTSKDAEIVKQENGYTISIDNEGYLEFTFDTMTINSKYTEKLIKNGQVEATVKGLVADGNEHAFAAVKEVNGMIKLYVDGKLVKSTYDENSVNPELNKGNIVFGNGLVGTLNNVKVYDSALAYDEVETISNEVQGTKVNLTASMLIPSSVDTTENINKSVSNLLDGNNTTFWATVPGGKLSDAYLQINLGEVKLINSVDLATRYDSSAKFNCTGNINNFIVQVSENGKTWTKVAEGDITNGKGEVTFAPVKAQYVKITSTSSYHWQYGQPGQPDNRNTVMCIADINVYEIDKTVKLDTSGMKATYNVNGQSGNITNIFDNNPETHWESASVSKVEKGNPNVVVELDDIYLIDQVDYTKRYHSGAANQWKCTGNIRKYVIEVSTDNQNWTTVSTGSTFDDEGYTSKGDGGTTNIKFNPIKAKYVRISATETYHWQQGQSGHPNNLNTVLTVGDLAIHGEKFSDYEITNLAEGVVPTAKWSNTNENCPVNSQRPLRYATDKLTNLDNYVDFGQDGNKNGAYIELDLGSDSYIDRIKLYRYWSNNRVYRNTVIAVSDDPYFSNPTIIFNSDKNNVHGLGVGNDEPYAESSAGREFVLDEYVTARYVRVYMNGQSDTATTNHIVELEVYGFNYDNSYIYEDVTFKLKDDSETVNHLFEGYYKDSEGLEVASKAEFMDETNEYFAKYVNPDVLTVKAQAKNNGDDNFTIRFVSSVTSLNLDKVGFEIKKANGQVKDVSTKTVYEVIKEKVSGNTLFTNPSDVFNAQSQYFFVVKLNNVPLSAGDQDIEVIPYWIPSGSNQKIYGKTRVEKLSTLMSSAPQTIQQ